MHDSLDPFLHKEDVDCKDDDDSDGIAKEGQYIFEEVEKS